MSRWRWAPYVPVAKRKAKALKEMDKLRKKGQCIQPVDIQGRLIAKSFWGKGWCTHLESFSDYENRLPRGRTYARNGSVCHLEVEKGKVKAIVSGSKLYNVSITIQKLAPDKWKSIKSKCSGQIGSIIELLQGRLSDEVMIIVTNQKEGLFPLPGEISLSCNCPDWAVMCKHVAAALYGIGNRLDTEPEMLFLLRGVDASELISEQITLPETRSVREDTLNEESLNDIFGIEMDDDLPSPKSANQSSKTKSQASRKKSVPQKAASKSARKNRTGTKISPEPFSPTGIGIKNLRIQAGLSVADFAKSIGVTPASIYRWEKTKGECRIHYSSFAALNDMHAKINCH